MQIERVLCYERSRTKQTGETGKTDDHSQRPTCSGESVGAVNETIRQNTLRHFELTRTREDQRQVVRNLDQRRHIFE